MDKVALLRMLAFTLPLVLFGLMLFPWPFNLINAAMVFDAPIKGFFDGITRWIVAISLVSYPLLYGVATFLSFKAMKNKRKPLIVLMFSCISILSAHSIFMIYMAFEILH
ncbi:hypothetical protein [Pseudoalteromonas phenolica]|uniref:Uncharacterized protein n=1 Tax=Pseudoalteromonas phenolica TaxID=161398 RepID=A0A0S2K3X9_9GAMM|nr:hypothetical protein [Pseudoalteromonas phenolica]ALO42771.1 hypothetical protein PP2015_2274 [Pseudoalteromonas phenolica]MBE0356102.1 hypothetical protein [Pseudoalteromonas phenolica O-BC30]